MSQTPSHIKTPALTEAPPIYYGILTDQGQALLAESIASGIPLPLTHMAVGDGAGQSVTPQPEMAALVNEVYRAPLNQLFVDPTAANQIVAEMVMGESTGGFWIRELGLYAESGALFAVANAPASYKPQLDEGAGRALLTRMVLIVSDTTAVELIINPDMVMASRAYVEAKIAEHAASRDHPAAAEGAQGMIPLATQDMVDEGIDHASALTPKTAGAAFARQQHEHEMDDILWLQQALDEKVSKVGDIMTGQLEVRGAIPRPILLDGGSNATSLIWGKRNGVDKWFIGLNGTGTDEVAWNSYAGNVRITLNTAGFAECSKLFKAGGFESTAVQGAAGNSMARRDFVEAQIATRAPMSHTHTPAEVGAAPLSHTHTAAQGNQDIVASGYGQVGTYALCKCDNLDVAVGPGTMIAGSQLRYSTCEGKDDGGSPAGTWKCLGYSRGRGDSAAWDVTLWIRVG